MHITYIHLEYSQIFKAQFHKSENFVYSKEHKYDSVQFWSW